MKGDENGGSWDKGGGQGRVVYLADPFRYR